MSKLKMAAGWAALVVAANLLAGPALASDPESERLGAGIAHSLTTAVDLKASLMAQTADLGAIFKDLKSRPDWPDMFRQSISDEMDADGPVFDQIIGHALAREFTKAELEAGVGLFDGPAHDEVMAAIRAGAQGKKPGPASPALNQALAKLQRQPGGPGFIKKMGHLESTITGASDDFAATLVAGVFRRFGEKAEAAERARRAAQD